jgi:hypothetical protein
VLGVFGGWLHHQFKDFLEEIDSPYSDLLLHNKV